MLNSCLNLAQKTASHSGLGSARPAEHPIEPEEADEPEGEAKAQLPIYTAPLVCGDHTPQTSDGLLGLGLDRLPPDMIDEGKILYKLGKQENKYIHSLMYFLLVIS